MNEPVFSIASTLAKAERFTQRHPLFVGTLGTNFGAFLGGIQGRSDGSGAIRGSIKGAAQGAALDVVTYGAMKLYTKYRG